MQFSNKKKAVAAAMIAVGGLALVGVGTGAAFTDTVTANMTVKTGTANLDIVDAPNFVISRGRQDRDPKPQMFTSTPLGGKSGFDAIKVKASAALSAPTPLRARRSSTSCRFGHCSEPAGLRRLAQRSIADRAAGHCEQDVNGTDNFTTEYFVPASDSRQRSAEGGTDDHRGSTRWDQCVTLRSSATRDRRVRRRSGVPSRVGDAAARLNVSPYRGTGGSGVEEGRGSPTRPRTYEIAAPAKRPPASAGGRLRTAAA